MCAEFWERTRRGVERQLQAGAYPGTHDAAKPWMSFLRDSAKDAAYIGMNTLRPKASQQQQPRSKTAPATMHDGATPKRVAKPKTGLSKDLRGDGRHIL
eukprot:3429813-Amphidinium_carterae.3